MAFYGQRTRFVLHSEVSSHGARAIANKAECAGKPLLWEEFVKEIVEGALFRADPSGLRGYYSVRSTNEP